MGDPIDEGTSALMRSAPPGPVGFNAKRGTAHQSSVGIGDSIVGYARSRRGSRVGNGECFALVHRALRAAGAKVASDFGRITPDADYVWGTSVSLAELQPGDVIQFRDYTYERVDVIKRDDATVTDEHAEDREHHSAIVQSVDGDGAVTVWEQNAPPGAAVTRTQLFFTSRTTTSGNRTTKISVRGTFWFYRPEAH
jgi:hypothetical protein